MLKTYTTSPLKYTFENKEIDHVISVQNNATYDFSHDVLTHDGLIELSIPFYQDYVPQGIQDGIFKNCGDLSSVEGLQIRLIGNKTFSNCDQLRKVYLPKATSIKEYAFENCNLSVVILSDSIKIPQIELNSFYNNFRRPISVYIPGNLSNDWYNSELNNNWKYTISSVLSSISAEFESKNYSIVVLSSNNNMYSPEIKNIMLSTSNKGYDCKTIWNALFPNTDDFISLVNTLSIFAYANDKQPDPYLTNEDKQSLATALTADDSYCRLSDVISNTKLSDSYSYSTISSDGRTGYFSKLRTITQFPLYEFDRLESFGKFRPLSAGNAVLSNKVNIDAAINNVYRTTQNTVAELIDVFEPLCAFAIVLSTSTEISSTALSNNYLNTLKSSIEYFEEAKQKFITEIK